MSAQAAGGARRYNAEARLRHATGGNVRAGGGMWSARVQSRRLRREPARVIKSEAAEETGAARPLRSRAYAIFAAFAHTISTPTSFFRHVLCRYALIARERADVTMPGSFESRAFVASVAL